MGISAIKCEGYSDVGDSGFGKGRRSSSDFSRSSIALTALGVVAAAGLSLVSVETETQAGVDKEAGQLTVGRIEGASQKGYVLKAEDDAFDAGWQIALYRIDDGILDSDAPVSNICRIAWEHTAEYGKAIYAVQCATPRGKDGLEVGDYVAVARAYDK